MSRVFCSYCLRCGADGRLPRGWKTCGGAVFCPQCRRRRYSLRSMTMTVAKPIGATWQELLSALDTTGDGVAPRDSHWEARLAEGRPVLRVLRGGRWWEMSLKSGVWDGTRRNAYEKIACGEARGELFLMRAASGAGRQVACRIVAWLPHEPEDGAPQDAPGRTGPDPRHLDTLGIGKLREAIRAKRVTFPSPVPALTTSQPGLPPRLAELYFVQGREIEDIGAQCGLSFWRVREILNAWKRAAVTAGCLQHTPPGQAMTPPPAKRDAFVPAMPGAVAPLPTAAICGFRSECW